MTDKEKIAKLIRERDSWQLTANAYKALLFHPDVYPGSASVFAGRLARVELDHEDRMNGIMAPDSERRTREIQDALNDDEIIAELNEILRRARARKENLDIEFDETLTAVTDGWYTLDELSRFHHLKMASGWQNAAAAKERIRKRRGL